MCILLALRPTGPTVRFPLIIAHNRDELRCRRTGELAVEASTGLCCARDFQGGGMDMALNTQSGRFVVLNNCRCLTRYPDDDPKKLSRGRLVEAVALEKQGKGQHTHYDPFYLFSVATTFTATPILQVKQHIPKRPSSSIDSVEWDESTVVPEGEVFVKSNEACWSEQSPWPKSEFLRERGRDLVAGLHAKSSVDEAAAAVMAAMSRSDPVCSREQWRATPSEVATWSPDPAREWWKVQAPFLPSTREFSAYGTVSQTLLMVDNELCATHLWMRPITVDEDSRSVFGHWTKFHFSWR